MNQPKDEYTRDQHRVVQVHKGYVAEELDRCGISRPLQYLNRSNNIGKRNPLTLEDFDLTSSEEGSMYATLDSDRNDKPSKNSRQGREESSIDWSLARNLEQTASPKGPGRSHSKQTRDNPLRNISTSNLQKLMLECTRVVPSLGRIRETKDYLIRLKQIIQLHLRVCEENTILCPICSNLDTLIDGDALEK